MNRKIPYAVLCSVLAVSMFSSAFTNAPVAKAESDEHTATVNAEQELAHDHDHAHEGEEEVQFDPALDTDGDGLKDAFEYGFLRTDLADSDGNGVLDGAEDEDGDGLSNLAEQSRGLNPGQADTDGDRLNDYAELYQYGTDPLKADTDGDMIDDGAELLDYLLDANNADQDGDGTLDGFVKRAYQLPANDYGITGTITGTGNTSESFYINRSPILIVKMMPSAKTFLLEGLEDSEFAINVPYQAEGNKSDMRLFRYVEDQVKLELIQKQHVDPTTNTIKAEFTGGGTFVVLSMSDYQKSLRPAQATYRGPHKPFKGKAQVIGLPGVFVEGEELNADGLFTVTSTQYGLTATTDPYYPPPVDDGGGSTGGTVITEPTYPPPPDSGDTGGTTGGTTTEPTVETEEVVLQPSTEPELDPTSDQGDGTATTTTEGTDVTTADPMTVDPYADGSEPLSSTYQVKEMQESPDGSYVEVDATYSTSQTGLTPTILVHGLGGHSGTWGLKNLWLNNNSVAWPNETVSGYSESFTGKTYSVYYSQPYSNIDVHYITGWSNSAEIGPDLENRGYRRNKELFIFEYHSTGHVGSGGRNLRDFIYNLKVKGKIPYAPVNLIAHSKGGLVSRYYIETLSGSANVKRLITLGTPHFGSDWMWANTDMDRSYSDLWNSSQNKDSYCSYFTNSRPYTRYFMFGGFKASSTYLNAAGLRGVYSVGTLSGSYDRDVRNRFSSKGVTVTYGDIGDTAVNIDSAMGSDKDPDYSGTKATMSTNVKKRWYIFHETYGQHSDMRKYSTVKSLISSTLKGYYD